MRCKNVKYYDIYYEKMYFADGFLFEKIISVFSSILF